LVSLQLRRFYGGCCIALSGKGGNVNKPCPTCGTPCTIIEDDIGEGLANQWLEPVTDSVTDLSRPWHWGTERPPQDMRRYQVITGGYVFQFDGEWTWRRWLIESTKIEVFAWREWPDPPETK